MPPSTDRKLAHKKKKLTLRRNRSASYWCRVGQQTCKTLLNPLLVHFWLFSTKLPGAKPVLSACSCTLFHSTLDLGVCADLSQVPSHLSTVCHDHYHDHQQPHDLCFRQVCQLSLFDEDKHHILMKDAETEDFQQVDSLQRFTRNTKCHSMHSSLPPCWLSSLVASSLARLGKRFPPYTCSI